MHDGDAEDDLISRDAEPTVGSVPGRTSGDRDDIRDEQPSEILNGGPETHTIRVAPAITLKAFLELPLGAEDLATLRACDVLSQAMVQTIDAEAGDGERRSP